MDGRRRWSGNVFEWKDHGSIHLALVRVYRLADPWVFTAGPEFSGCKSWVDLPGEPNAALLPVLDEAAHQAKMSALREVLS